MGDLLCRLGLHKWGRYLVLADCRYELVCRRPRCRKVQE